jgi:hypothetical protein
MQSRPLNIAYCGITDWSLFPPSRLHRCIQNAPLVAPFQLSEINMPTVPTTSDKSQVSESVKEEESFAVPESQKHSFVRPSIGLSANSRAVEACSWAH